MIWIDVLKGLGILLVVAGHVFEDEPRRYIFMFHMPLFFLVSGYLFRPDADEKSFFLKKARHLLLPYAAFLLLFFVPELLEAARHLLFHGPGNAQMLKATLWGGRRLQGWGAVFWFVTCLFATQQLMNWLFKRWRPPVVGLAMLPLLGLAYVNARYFPSASLPLDLNVVLMAAPLFYLGWLCRDRQLVLPAPWALAGAALGAALIAAGYDNSFDMKNAAYGIPVVTLASAVCASALLMRAARWLAQFGWPARALSRLGAASMVIMYVHQPVQLTLVQEFGVDDPWLRLACALVIGLLLFGLLSRYALLGRLFLGTAGGKPPVPAPARQAKALS